MSSPPLTLAPTSVDRKPQLWAALTSFFLMWSFLTLVLIVFRPSWVCVPCRDGEAAVVEGRPPVEPKVDYAKSFIVALVVTLVVMLIAWLVMATSSASK